ncbi:DNA-binding response OmpR family regulator [Clostridium acetobutylicum]|uniref:Stage 0 sporulation protein A homolog n=1 Tax=Clostridium acetobutylicum (strain ATCC 824 / DSM 792 / JCM 1419 / IAM 19013 / LMG 5710 / NBRC 13948 / NRRL B-527 / VKM B-1787 / 2291 / W) TaxID=272562 RepID=Q97M29_CLOAB|nr:MULTISPECIES: response regulator transcription factor [Clostridium]AAK78351.1 Response regulator (CheY-like domain and HTH domain) [Clostridium acetobutylicum ATCC 824]ADZ19420.1 Response regulator (CheY-like domain and HTH domain) [Clostridium acetobutylicum EA 2018]AEI31203.1 response regulator [Clostridium acetobutylicum DSM 1731]AWV80075.1 DNA-binding response regulator [Clostridium acetobutylicum]MBC2395897.1 response regulator transcription factor [Clostridium acetobutylicum]
MYKILIIEDDKKLAEFTEEYLKRYNYEVFKIFDFKKVEEEFEKINPELVLLDVNLPYYDGFNLCRIFRRKSKAPIIFMSARSSEIEQIRGLEMGADDYITKPFSFELLLAKVQASIRRTYGEYSEDNSEVLTVSGIIVDKNTFKMTYKDKEVELTKNELKLITKLLKNINKVVTREELLEELWDESSFVDDNTLTVNVTRIKNKLSEVGIKNVVKNKRGIGYYLDFKG